MHWLCFAPLGQDPKDDFAFLKMFGLAEAIR